MGFPMIVYRDKGQHQRKGGTFSYLQVHTEQQLSAALADGWFRSVEEAIEGKRRDPAPQELQDNSAPTRAELEQKARQIGLQYDGRIGDRKLAAMISEKLAA